jgi:hypothetical protein
MQPVRSLLTALRQRRRDDLQLRTASPETIAPSLRGVAPLAQDFRTSPERLGPELGRQYRLY